ncbi:hypothetical protein shim_10040 [Shimia sp. SK013]|uniref:hypothetical protein n=1 Tax=Shimia sp. SK013 TaxID=1389006 RepID=UPI0006B5DBAF|nr:hypothetical protein [Shimia sp. SK013]KPA22717.1 hypothetical protein shim_10040 [Shimia sp. SK013]
MDTLGFGLSAFFAHVLTNIDNLAIMSGLILTSGKWRVVSCYLVAQLIVLGVALRLADGLVAQMPNITGYLGFVPVVIGILELRRRIKLRGVEEEAAAVQIGSVAIVALFLSVSLDTFAVFAPLFADSTAEFRIAAAIGAAVSAVGLAAGAAILEHVTRGFMSRLVKLERLTPYVMIVVGFYVLLNTGTDVS